MDESPASPPTPEVPWADPTTPAMPDPEASAQPAASPRFEVRRPIWSSIQILVDGVPLKKQGLFGSRYLLPMPDGTTKEVELKGALGGARIVVDGVEHRVEPELPKWALVLALLPIALVAVGGAIGGAFGGIGAILNLRIAGLKLNAGVKVAAMLVVSAIAFVAWLGIALALRPSVDIGVGTCVNGVRADIAYDPNAVRIVDCAPAHDAEMFGEYAYTASTTYPGFDTLQAFAETVCFPAFEAFVGIPTSQSVIGILPLLPTEQSWAANERSVLCFAATPDGSRLTGSVRGIRR